QSKLLITNPAINELLKNINIAGSDLMASSQSYAHMHNKICAVILYDSFSSLFITINSANLHSPIVIMYARNKINFENISPKNFLKTTERAQLVHLDPLAVTKYFNIIIRCILDIIVGYGKEQDGVFVDKDVQCFIEDIDESSNDSTTNNDHNQDEANKLFFILSFSRKLTIANLHIDYQFKGSSLCKICLYNYATIIKKYDFTNSHHESEDRHSQNKSHIQKSRNKESEKNYCINVQKYSANNEPNVLDNDNIMMDNPSNEDLPNFDPAKIIRSDLKNVRMLLLYLIGAGGIGKFKIIDAISSYFKCCSQQNTLLVLASTGSAAAKIKGNTLHSMCGFGFKEFFKDKHSLSEDLLQQLQKY
ncbi:21956_t:CDS:2, partial [Cetraspora pellucida]